MNPWILLGALLAFIGAYWLGDHNGASRARDKAIAEQSVTQDKVAVETDRRAIVSSEASTNMLDYLATQKPAIEIRTHETTERIRTVYKDRVVPAVCVAAVARPASVQSALDEARDRANAAISAVRVGTTVSGAADP